MKQIMPEIESFFTEVYQGIYTDIRVNFGKRVQIQFFRYYPKDPCIIIVIRLNLIEHFTSVLRKKVIKTFLKILSSLTHFHANNTDNKR